MRFLATANVLIVFFVMGFAGSAVSGMYDFESGTGINYLTYTSRTTSQEPVSDPVYQGSYSGKIDLPDTDNYGKLTIDVNGLPLAQMSGTFWTNVTQSYQSLVPYMMFAVDGNSNGIYDYGATKDSLVIAFGGNAGPVQGDWVQSGMDATTTVHVVGNRSGLDSGTFSASGTQDTISALSDIEFDNGIYWGDLNVHQVGIAAGYWPTDGTIPYTAFVDNIEVSEVPVPAAVWLLGSGLLGLVGLRKKIRK
jgi:hypothetical protein